MSSETMHGVIYKDADSDQWVAVCLEIDIATQGDNAVHAREMLKEAVELHIEDMTHDELDALYQRIEGEPIVIELAINAPSVLHR